MIRRNRRKQASREQREEGRWKKSYPAAAAALGLRTNRMAALG